MSIRGILKIIAAAGLIVMIAVPLFYYHLLPDGIPRHYNFAGHPDGFGPRGMIRTLPAISAGVFLLLILLPRLIRKQNPNKHHKHKEFTGQQQSLILLPDLIIALILAAFACTLMSIHVAFADATGPGIWFTPVFMILLIFIPMIYSLILIRRKSH